MTKVKSEIKHGFIKCIFNVRTVSTHVAYLASTQACKCKDEVTLVGGAFQISEHTIDYI